MSDRKTDMVQFNLYEVSKAGSLTMTAGEWEESVENEICSLVYIISLLQYKTALESTFTIMLI